MSERKRSNTQRVHVRTRSRLLARASIAVAFFLIAVSQPTDAQPAVPATASELTPATTIALTGIWTNPSRFVEFTADNKMRIVLKPYYGFVYEDTGWIPCSSTAANTFAASSSVYDIAVHYTGEKKDQFVPVAVIGDGMYFRFFTRYGATTTADTAAPAAPAAPAATVVSAAGNATTALATAFPLDGFWLASGNADELRLYRSDEIKEFFSYYFSGGTYYKIRYWMTDARKKDVEARFPGPDDAEIGIPKFIEIGDKLYTCITSTGTVLRNYETGSWSVTDGKISFKPVEVAFAGTAAAIREPSAITLSSDGTVLAFGKPYLTRSAIANLDAEITAHNGLRRPPRKPVFGYMELDFHWDEIEKIRNNGVVPSTGK